MKSQARGGNSEAAEEARKRFAQDAQESNRTRRQEIERLTGKIISELTLDDMERLAPFDQGIADRSAFLKALRAPFADIPNDELEREIEDALAEVREEMKLERAANTKA